MFSMTVYRDLQPYFLHLFYMLQINITTRNNYCQPQKIKLQFFWFVQGTYAANGLEAVAVPSNQG